MDANTIPVIGLATTLLLVTSAIVLSINLTRAVALTTYQLRTYFNYPPHSVERLEFKAVLYVVATAVTVAICVAALFVDFFLLNARRGSRACDGLTTCYVMMGILFATLIGWLWILHKAIEAQFLYRIFVNECTSPTIGTRCLWMVWIRWFRPNNIAFNNCQADFVANCDVMNQCYPLYYTIATCAVLIVLCIIHYLVCMATHYAYFSREPEQEELPPIRSESSSVLSSRSSRHSSMRSRGMDRNSDSDESRRSYNQRQRHM